MGTLNEEASHDASSDEFVESEDGELYRLEIRNGKKVFTKPRHNSSKGNTEGRGKSKTDKEFFIVDELATSEPIAEPRLTLMEDFRNPHPRHKTLEIVRKTKKSQHVPLGIFDLGSFEVVSDHGDTVEDDFVVDESSEEFTDHATVATCFLTQRDKEFKTRRREFSKTTQCQRPPRRHRSLIVGIGCMSSLTFCSMRTL